MYIYAILDLAMCTHRTMLMLMDCHQNYILNRHQKTKEVTLSKQQRYTHNILNVYLCMYNDRSKCLLSQPKVLIVIEFLEFLLAISDLDKSLSVSVHLP